MLTFRNHMAEATAIRLIQPKYHVVLDLETLGVGHDAQIFQIGAAVIERGRIVKTFSKVIRLCGELTVDADTLRWWITKPELFRAGLYDGDASLRGALIDFDGFLSSLDGEYVLVGNGASFDITILESAYKKENRYFPCSYKQYRDLRTYIEVYERYTNTPVRSLMNDHTAVDDAINEAKLLIEILEFFNPIYNPLNSKQR